MSSLRAGSKAENTELSARVRSADTREIFTALLEKRSSYFAGASQRQTPHKEQE
jgi:hypothetical protein